MNALQQLEQQSQYKRVATHPALTGSRGLKGRKQMLTDALLEELCYRGEGSDLDYKAGHYPFAKASDEEKSEILKDTLPYPTRIEIALHTSLWGSRRTHPIRLM